MRSEPEPAPDTVNHESYLTPPLGRRPDPRRYRNRPRASGVFRCSAVLRASGFPGDSDDVLRASGLPGDSDDVLRASGAPGAVFDTRSGRRGGHGTLIRRSSVAPRSDMTLRAACGARDTSASANSPASFAGDETTSLKPGHWAT